MTKAAFVFRLILIMAIAGCARSQSAAAPQNKKLGALALMYGKYLAAHGGMAPANQKGFASFINEHESSTLKRFGISTADELFAADADQPAFVVEYGATSVAEANPIIAYQSEPNNGKRRVVRSSGAVEELAEANFQREKPAALTTK